MCRRCQVAEHDYARLHVPEATLCERGDCGRALTFEQWRGGVTDCGQHMTPDETRAALATLAPCSPGCPGWAVMDSDERGTEIQRCDACCAGAGGGPAGRDIDDTDVNQLPEAQDALRKATL